MKHRGWKMEDGGWPARSFLECGSPLALSHGSTSTRGNQSARGLAHSKTWRSFVASLVFLAPAIIAHAQSYTIDWFTIDGGGGTSTGGVYSVTGTIGQPDAGKMSGGNFTIDGGFWGIIATVQTPGAPFLSIVPAASGQATISWTPNTPGFVLQETLSLSPTNWVNSVSGVTNPIVVPATLPTKFYRLFKP